MSCRTCDYMEQRNYIDQNGTIRGSLNVCVAQKGEPKVNPDDICEFYKDKFKEENNMGTVNKKCAWLGKNNVCFVDENAMVKDPDCDGCQYFEESKYDVVSRPSHYAAGRKYEPKDVIRDWELNFNLGNAVKYISRAGRKDDLIEDLRKARQYLDFEIEYLEKKFGERF